ncbi:MAG: hypothetical protein Q7T73_03320 [Beijerinckiaceae bacterium]|nr:hypothetical protein [Beijerinckiaceae bacterium]
MLVLSFVMLMGLPLVVACSGSENPDTEVLVAGDVAVLKETEPFSGDVGGMGVSGTIAIVDGCVGVAGSNQVIVFPPSTEVKGSGDDLVLTVDGIELRVGDAFDAGTRGSDGASLDDFGDLAEEAPESCRDNEAVQLEEFG